MRYECKIYGRLRPSPAFSWLRHENNHVWNNHVWLFSGPPPIPPRQSDVALCRPATNHTSQEAGSSNHACWLCLSAEESNATARSNAIDFYICRGAKSIPLLHVFANRIKCRPIQPKPKYEGWKLAAHRRRGCCQSAAGFCQFHKSTWWINTHTKYKQTEKYILRYECKCRSQLICWMQT